MLGIIVCRGSFMAVDFGQSDGVYDEGMLYRVLDIMFIGMELD